MLLIKHKDNFIPQFKALAVAFLQDNKIVQLSSNTAIVLSGSDRLLMCKNSTPRSFAFSSPLTKPNEHRRTHGGPRKTSTSAGLLALDLKLGWAHSSGETGQPPPNNCLGDPSLQRLGNHTSKNSVALLQLQSSQIPQPNGDTSREGW